MGLESVCDLRFLRNEAEGGFVNAMGEEGRGVMADDEDEGWQLGKEKLVVVLGCSLAQGRIILSFSPFPHIPPKSRRNPPGCFIIHK